MKLDWLNPAFAVAEARRKLGLSAEALARQLGLGEDGGRTVRRWEAGDSDVSGPTRMAIEHLLWLHSLSEREVVAALRDENENAIANAVARSITTYTELLAEQTADGWPEKLRLPAPTCPLEHVALKLFSETITDKIQRRTLAAMTEKK